mgnify:FL=1
MFIWTSKVRSTVLVLALAVTACVAPAPSSKRAFMALDQSLVIAGPTGYCVDPQASRSSSRDAFVLLVPCTPTGPGKATAAATHPAIITASVVAGAVPPGGIDLVLSDLERFFTSAEGRAMLSRDGDAALVSIDDIGRSGSVLYLRAIDRSESAGQSVEPGYWRAFLGIRGTLVTLTVLSLADRPVSTNVQRRLLEAFVARVASVNAAG